MRQHNKIARVIMALRDYYTDKSMLGSLGQKTPFYILISTVLSARNRDEQTKKAVSRLFSRYSTPKQIATASIRELERLIKPSGIFRVKARRIKEISQQILDNHKGDVPDSMDGLVSLPGVGRKTAGCVLVYAYNKPAIPVDTHVHRISNRLGWVRTRMPEQTEQELMKIVPKRYWLLVNEVFVLHGQQICRPIVPMCSRCPVFAYCKRVGVRQHS